MVGQQFDFCVSIADPTIEVIIIIDYCPGMVRFEGKLLIPWAWRTYHRLYLDQILHLGIRCELPGPKSPIPYSPCKIPDTETCMMYHDRIFVTNHKLQDCNFSRCDTKELPSVLKLIDILLIF